MRLGNLTTFLSKLYHPKENRRDRFIIYSLILPEQSPLTFKQYCFILLVHSAAK